MTEEVKTIAQWGYSKNDAQIFDLTPGEGLPPGYYDNPAKVSGSAAQKQYIADCEAEGAQIPAEFMPKKSSAPIDKTDR